MNKKEQFIEKLKKIYPRQFEAILKEISVPRHVTFRINTLVTSELKVLNELADLGFEVKNGPFENSYILLNERSKKLPYNKLSETDLVNNGKIYIQGLSSMLAPLVLSPLIGQNIADFCASPGSKTSQIAINTRDKSTVFAFDNNINRINTLKSVLKLQSIASVQTMKLNSALLQYEPQFLNYFDSVLVDVPCSNEGLIRDVENHDFTQWNVKHAKSLSQLQKKLIFSALKVLKPGGSLVYSTCTYSFEENEGVLDWALSRFKDVSLVDINNQILEVKKIENKLAGFTTLNDKTLSSEVAKAIRILPNEYFDGFFVAKLIKSA